MHAKWKIPIYILSGVTLTVPGFDTSLISFLPRSNNIKCSAILESDNKLPFSLSSFLFAPLFLVPAIGLIVTFLLSGLIRISDSENQQLKIIKIHIEKIYTV